MKHLKHLLLVAVALLIPNLSHAAAGPWTISNAFKTRILNGGGLDIDTDTIKVALVASTSNVVSGPADCYTGGTGTALTGELSTANGYTAGGATAASLSISGTSTVTYDFADITWTASGGSIVARYAVVYDSTAASKTIIAYALLDSTPADVTVTAGNTLTIGVANVFTLALEAIYPAGETYAGLGAVKFAPSANDPIYSMRKAG